MLTAFERLIELLPPGISVMDVGYGGLDGENTTNYLRARFGLIDGLNKTDYAVARYRALYPDSEKDQVYFGTYPQDMPGERYDLLVLDPNIEGNLAFWTPHGMETAFQFVKDGGHIITYVMTTDLYGDPTTQKMIAEHRANWWAKKVQLPIVAQEHEERRQYISWVLLKK